jgi:hypothetical protein
MTTNPSTSAHLAAKPYGCSPHVALGSVAAHRLHGNDTTARKPPKATKSARNIFFKNLGSREVVYEVHYYMDEETILRTLSTCC